ncbi:PaaI family thioesterase [Marinibaculum pumilum]|uniref:PaaI family thioesterase n=1 Tax=Marinibaculum pumilum TaxID=1766165 RepID=A0ABV7KZY9_9PROT
MTDQNPISAGPPPGFHRLEMPRGFISVNGPLYMRQDPGDASAGIAPSVALGMLVEAKHGNPRGVCHGGMMMTFADILLAIVVRHAEPQLGMMPTVSMSTDFLAGAPVGSFLTGTGRLLKRTRKLAFAEGRVMAGETLALRVSGILKIPSRPLVPADRLPAGAGHPPPPSPPNDDGPMAEGLS